MKYAPWALVLILAVVFGAVLYFQNHVSREEVALQRFHDRYGPTVSLTVEFPDAPFYRWESETARGNATIDNGKFILWGMEDK